MSGIFSADQFVLSRAMKIALGFSVVLHVGVFILGAVGMPYLAKPPPPINQSIAIEVVDAADLTTTKKPPEQSKLKPVPDKPKDAPKAEEKKIKAPPKVEAKEPPKMKPIEKPPVEKKDTVKPKPKVAPPPSEKLEKPKPPEKKKEESVEEAIQQEDPLESLMKNLQESEPSSETDGLEKVAESRPDAPIAQYITQNELSSLTNQLVGCWRIPIGAKDVHNMVVTLHIWANKDRSVKRVEIQEQWRMATDPAFQALAESARTAVLSPSCNPLDIPKDKYNVWKDQYIEVIFDPSHVT